MNNEFINLLNTLATNNNAPMFVDSQNKCQYFYELYPICPGISAHIFSYKESSWWLGVISMDKNQISLENFASTHFYCPKTLYDTGWSAIWNFANGLHSVGAKIHMSNIIPAQSDSEPLPNSPENGTFICCLECNNFSAGLVTTTAPSDSDPFRVYAYYSDDELVEESHYMDRIRYMPIPTSDLSQDVSFFHAYKQLCSSYTNTYKQRQTIRTSSSQPISNQGVISI